MQCCVCAAQDCTCYCRHRGAAVLKGIGGVEIMKEQVFLLKKLLAPAFLLCRSFMV